MIHPDWHESIPSLLSDPAPSDWRKVCLILDKLTPDERPEACRAVQQCLKKWTAAALKAVPREPLSHWTKDAGHGGLLSLCLRVRETQTYAYYETYVCNDPALLWRECGPWGNAGCQQVHLVRAFSGSARNVRTDAWLRIGEPGQGDLVGWFSLWLPPYGVIAVKLELEIKMPSGRLTPAQRKRRDELARAGGIYLSAKSVRSAVMQLTTVRSVLQSGAGIEEAVNRAEGLGW